MPDRQIMNFFSVYLAECEYALLVTLSEFSEFESIW